MMPKRILRATVSTQRGRGFSLSLGERIPRNQISRIEPLNRGADVPACRVADILVGRARVSWRTPKLLTLAGCVCDTADRNACAYVRFMGRTGAESANKGSFT